MKWLALLLLSYNAQAEFTVWNVGQGLWTTFQENRSCLHFDLGGEQVRWQTPLKVCAQKENRLYLSHWDWDHIGFIRKAARLFRQVCVAQSPLGEAPNWKKKIFQALHKCPEALTEVRRLSGARILGRSSNASSQVFLVRNRYLLPGDSEKAQEKVWARETLKDVKVLVLGHHGSRTSTSAHLLNRLPHLKMAVASSRTKKYGHPHKEVAVRLKSRGISLLKTEDWGNLHFTRGKDDTPYSNHERQARSKHSHYKR